MAAFPRRFNLLCFHRLYFLPSSMTKMSPKRQTLETVNVLHFAQFEEAPLLEYCFCFLFDIKIISNVQHPVFHFQHCKKKKSDQTYPTVTGSVSFPKIDSHGFSGLLFFIQHSIFSVSSWYYIVVLWANPQRSLPKKEKKMVTSNNMESEKYRHQVAWVSSWFSPRFLGSPTPQSNSVIWILRQHIFQVGV